MFRQNKWADGRHSFNVSLNKKLFGNRKTDTEDLKDDRMKDWKDGGGISDEIGVEGRERGGQLSPSRLTEKQTKRAPALAGSLYHPHILTTCRLPHLLPASLLTTFIAFFSRILLSFLHARLADITPSSLGARNSLLLTPSPHSSISTLCTF